MSKQQKIFAAALLIIFNVCIIYLATKSCSDNTTELSNQVYNTRVDKVNADLEYIKQQLWEKEQDEYWKELRK